MDHEVSERCYMTAGKVLVDSGIIGNLSLIGVYGNGVEYEMKNFAVPTLLFD